MPKVSVVVPIYNVEKYLRECLDSVINQTLKDIEIICINDGSPDKSIDILREYEQKDSRIVVIDKENEGVGISRNKGIDIAKGEFVCFMDPDDFYPTEDILEVLYNKAIENNVKICGGEFVVYNDFDKSYNQNFKKNSYGYLFEEDGIIEYKDYQFDYGYHRFIYNKEFLLSNRIYFPSYKRYEDPVFFVKAMQSAGIFYAVDKIVYAYRMRHKLDSWSYETTRDLLKGIVDVLEFANANNLDGLSSITYDRLCNEYYRKIRCYVVNDNKVLLKKCVELAPQMGKMLVMQNLKCLAQNIFDIRNEYIDGKKSKILTIFGKQMKIGGKCE